MKAKNVVKFIVAILVCQIAGLIGSVFTAPSIPEWYANLQKPFFSPPNWVFAPAWITLYILMGVSLYLVWRKGWHRKGVRTGLLLFGIQLVLNAAWSIIFFGLQNPLLAFVEIIVLWLAIVLTIHQFWRIKKPAAYLLIPYILWVSFAAALNFFIWRLNL
jgi:tryptophan-rich sensory protein